MDQLINTTTKLALTLRAVRKSRGLSQVDAANRSSLLPKTISLLENHPEKCSIEILMKHLSSLNLELILQDHPVFPGIDNSQEW